MLGTRHALHWRERPEATITFPVPSTTTSRFAVAAMKMPGDLTDPLHGSPAGPYHAHIAGRLGSPQLRVTREDFSCLRWDPGHIKAARPEDGQAARAFNEATEFAVITAFAPITDQPRGVQVARAAAHAIADATGGITADLITGHVLAPSATERTHFVLADGSATFCPRFAPTAGARPPSPTWTPRASTAAPAYSCEPTACAASVSRSSR